MHAFNYYLGVMNKKTAHPFGDTLSIFKIKDNTIP